MKISQQFMILTRTGEPAWPHEPFFSLPGIGWSFRPYEWHDLTPEAVGQNERSAKTRARLLIERA
jgi:hypothetical protein